MSVLSIPSENIIIGRLPVARGELYNGQMTLLAGAIEAVRPDLVLVEPAGTPPHKRARCV